MSLSAPARRITSRCLLCQNLPIRARPHHPQRMAIYARRHASNDNSSDQKANPILDAYRRNNPHTGTAPTRSQAHKMPQQGDIASSSIFEDDRRMHAQRDEQGEDMEAKTKIGGHARDPVAIARVIHPDPKAREKWERKQVIKMVKRGGRLTKPQFLKRTEREHLSKSHNMKTSVKKLGMIARQIAGKTIDDAIVQMRFSKKKVAQEVLKQLEFARDEAIVSRGMGLKPLPEDGLVLDESSQDVNGAAAAALKSDRVVPTQLLKSEQPVEIRLKDGKRHKIDHPTKIYIDQAWVGRGPYGQLPDYRARGVTYIMKTPWTSLSVVLKEERTRMREHEEREAKRIKRITDNMWVHLPDRPIQTHRQWYSW